MLVLYARYYLACMHEYGYIMLWYGTPTYACAMLYTYCILKANYSSTVLSTIIVAAYLGTRVRCCGNWRGEL